MHHTSNSNCTEILWVYIVYKNFENYIIRLLMTVYLGPMNHILNILYNCESFGIFQTYS